MPENAVVVLGDEHSRIRVLFHRLPAAPDAELAPMLDEIITAMRVHAATEEDIVYPAVRDHVPDVAADIDRALQEHREIAESLDRVRSELGTPTSLRGSWLRRVGVIFERIEEHVIAEENGPFDRLRRALDAEALATLALAIEERRLRPV